MVWPWSPIQQQLNFFFPPNTHPYALLRQAIDREIRPTSTVLDVGCGRTASELRALQGKARKLYGIDIVEFTDTPEGTDLIRCGIEDIPLKDDAVDLVYSRAVMEHVENVQDAYREIFRVLKSGGCYIFITPNIYDYASIISSIIPNRWHPSIVKFAEGRDKSDVFPTFYRSNRRKRVLDLAARAGFEVQELGYVGQYPNYLMFSRPLFFLGCVYATLLRKASILAFLQGWLFCILRKP